MKILLLNHSDSGGGAAIAALRLTKALISIGVDVTLGVIEKKTNYAFVKNISQKKTFFYKIKRKIYHKFESVLFRYFRTTNGIFHSLNLYSQINVQEINTSDYDIVHLHWINNNMISIKDIAKITKPIVWTLHDSWPFCGAEHHPNVLENDLRYKTGYFKDNRPTSTNGFDICRWVFNRKKKCLLNKDITFISPSYFEKKLINESFLFNKKKCHIIPNVIDQNIFYKKNKEEISKILNLQKNKQVIGFGAAYDISNKKSLKGGYLLIDALKKISSPENYQLLIFGPAPVNFTSELDIPVFYAGYIENTILLAALYNCCDIFVCPSIIESFGYTCLEAISCGVPVAAFNIGGIPDIIDHKKNGYLAKPFDTGDLYMGMLYCLENHDKLSNFALQKVTADFNQDDIIKKHIEVYRYTRGAGNF